eukprot:14285138-Alexandrium_andersonii.AAC.1
MGGDGDLEQLRAAHSALKQAGQDSLAAKVLLKIKAAEKSAPKQFGPRTACSQAAHYVSACQSQLDGAEKKVAEAESRLLGLKKELDEARTKLQAAKAVKA